MTKTKKSRRLHRWILPGQIPQAAEDVNARVVMPAHLGRFVLSVHTWDEPYRRLLEASQGRSYTLQTPRIGEVVEISDSPQTFPVWWEDVSG